MQQNRHLIEILLRFIDTSKTKAINRPKTDHRFDKADFSRQNVKIKNTIIHFRVMKPDVQLVTKT